MTDTEKNVREKLDNGWAVEASEIRGLLQLIEGLREQRGELVEVIRDLINQEEKQ